MKNEKFCFSKGTGLIALVGIVLVAAALLMGGLSSKSTSTSTRASTGGPDSDTTTCLSGYSLTVQRYGVGDPGAVAAKQKVALNGCERSEYTPKGERTTLHNTGKKCTNGATDTFTTDLVACPLSCIYGDKVLSWSVPPVDYADVNKTTYYLDPRSQNSTPLYGCVTERYSTNEGVGGRLTGYMCDFSTPKAKFGGVFADMRKSTVGRYAADGRTYIFPKCTESLLNARVTPGIGTPAPTEQDPSYIACMGLRNNNSMSSCQYGNQDIPFGSNPMKADGTYDTTMVCGCKKTGSNIRKYPVVGPVGTTDGARN